MVIHQDDATTTIGFVRFSQNEVDMLFLVNIVITSEKPVINVSLGKVQKTYLSAQLDNGDFDNASELINEALRLHEQHRNQIISNLRAEIDKAWDGPRSFVDE